MTPERLVRLLALHPVLPGELAPPATPAVQALLADLARGARSSRAVALREVAAEQAIPVAELARRAEFLLACLALPVTGTHYQVLGVPETATTREIRRRWAALMQRYHPDRAGGDGGWLDRQARRLLEAYEVLRDPARRGAYDLALAQARGTGNGGRPGAGAAAGAGGRIMGRARWRWVPIGILAAGVALAAWAASGGAR